MAPLAEAAPEAMIPQTETIIHWGGKPSVPDAVYSADLVNRGKYVFLGNLYALVYAFGQNIWWGLGVLLIPLFSFVYCLRHWDRAAYAGRLLIGGFLIAGIPCLLFVTVLLYRFD